MARRMAYPGRGSCLKGLALVLALVVGFAAGASAQQPAPSGTPEAADPKQEGQLPPVTRECQVGTTEVVNQTPLPNVLKALRERQRIKILAIGASPVVRRDANAGDYYDLVEQLLEQTFKGLQVEVVHRGVSGELARDAGARIKMEVALVEPDLILWQLGTADALARLSIEDFEKSVRKTLIWLREHNVDVALIGLHYVKSLTKDAHYQAVRRALKKVATEEGVMRVGRYEAMETLARLRGEQAGQGSARRMTEAAYECSAEYLARAIATGLFHKDRPPLPPAKPTN